MISRKNSLCSLLAGGTLLLIVLMLVMMGMPGREVKVISAYLWPAVVALTGLTALLLAPKSSVAGFVGLGMALWFVVCTVANGDLYLEFNRRFVAVMWMTYGLCLPLMLLLDSKARESWLERITAVYGLFMLVLSLLCVYAAWTNQSILLPGMEGDIGISKKRLYALCKHPNEIGCCMNLSLICWLFLMMRSRKPLIKTLCVLSLLPQVFAIALTASRTSIATAALVLGTASMVGMTAAIRKHRTWMRWLTGTCAFVAAAAVALWMMNALIPDLMQQKDSFRAEAVLIQTARAEESKPEIQANQGSQFEHRDFTVGLGTFSLRTEIWQAGIQYLQDNPRTLLLGATDGQVSRIPNRYLGRDVHHMHNSWLEMLLQTGIPGFLAYVFIIVRMLWAAAKQFFCLQKPSWQRFLAAAPVVMLVCTMMEIYPCISGNVMDMIYMLLAGAVIALDEPLRKHNA